MNEEQVTAWLTTQKAAEALGIKRGYIQQLYRRGRFPHAQKIGNTLFIPPEDIEEFRKEQEFSAEHRFYQQSVASQFKALFFALQSSVSSAIGRLNDGLDSNEPEKIRECAVEARDELKKALYREPFREEEE